MLNKYRTLFILILGLLILALAGCQSSSGPQITVEKPWGRPSPQAARAGAFFMTLKNSGNQADKLVAASSPACGVVELHESYDKGDGVMGMREVEGGYIEVPAKGQAELKMGGLHIMCIDKLEDFELGAVLPLTLDFEISGQQTLDVEIRMPDM